VREEAPGDRTRAVSRGLLGKVGPAARVLGYSRTRSFNKHLVDSIRVLEMAL
jgi:hypothetical protein